MFWSNMNFTLVGINAIIISVFVSLILDFIQALRKKSIIFFSSPYIQLFKETTYLKNILKDYKKSIDKNIPVDLIAVQTQGNNNQLKISEIFNLAIKNKQSIILLGVPGSGKSTVIKAFSFRIARKAYIYYLFFWITILGIAIWLVSIDPVYSLLWLMSPIFWKPLIIRVKVPILVYGNQISHNNEFKKWKQGKIQDIFMCANHCLRQEKLVIWFIDGVNEINRQIYDEYVTGWKKEIKSESSSGYIFTCRSLEDPSKSLGLEKASVYQVCELDDEGIKEFFRIYGKSLDEHGYSQWHISEEDVTKFAETLKQRGLMDKGGIARNPLWLKTIIESDHYSRNKGALFYYYAKTLLGNELIAEKNAYQRRKYPDWKEIISPQKEIRALSALAKSMHLYQGHMTVGYHDEEQWDHGIAILSDHLGTSANSDDVIWEAHAANLLRIVPQKEMEFAHQQIQEFFAALALSEEKYWPICKSNIENFDWWQTIFLMAGLLDLQGDQFRSFLIQLFDDVSGDALKFSVILALGILASVENPQSQDINFVIQKFLDTFEKDFNQSEEKIIHELAEKLGNEIAIAFGFLYFDLQEKNRILGAKLLRILGTKKSAELLLLPFSSKYGKRTYEPLRKQYPEVMLFAIRKYIFGELTHSIQIDNFILEFANQFPKLFIDLPSIASKSNYSPKNAERHKLYIKLISLNPTIDSIRELIYLTSLPFEDHSKEIASLIEIASDKFELVSNEVLNKVFCDNNWLPIAARIFEDIGKNKVDACEIFEPYFLSKDIKLRQLITKLLLQLENLNLNAQDFLMNELKSTNQKENWVGISETLACLDDLNPSSIGDLIPYFCANTAHFYSITQTEGISIRKFERK